MDPSLKKVLLSGVSLSTLNERFIMLSSRVAKKWRFTNMPISVQIAIEPNPKIRKMMEQVMGDQNNAVLN